MIRESAFAEKKNVAAGIGKDGAILRTRLEGKTAWCERRLLARIHRSTIDKLRREIEPVSAGEFLQFLACWQHVDAEFRLEGPRGVAEVLTQLAGFEAPARIWESQILPNRVRDYRREWLDEVTMSGEFAWGRLWGGAGSAIRVTPIAIVPREQLDDWLSLAAEPNTKRMSGPAADLLAAMTAGGPMFPQNFAQGSEAGARACRNGPGRFVGPRACHVRLVRRDSTDDHAPFAPAPCACRRSAAGVVSARRRRKETLTT